jgi:predicted 3-demethylubiquinone-9 3-methyltransferase (glyoxalase superfamily)
MNQQKVIPFLMFTGKAEEAMNDYVSIFEGSEINSSIIMKTDLFCMLYSN